MFVRLGSGLRPWLPAALSNGLTTVGLLAMVLGTSRGISYMTYHNEARTRLWLNKDAPVPRGVQGAGRIFG